MILVVLGLAAHYITYVVTQSDFPPVEWLRTLVFNRWGGGSWQWYLINCGWCISAYASAQVVVPTAMLYNVPLPLAVWLAVASISGTLILLVNGVMENKSMLQRREISERGRS